MNFDLDIVPFSCYGAWSALSHIKGGRLPENSQAGVYFLSMHGQIESDKNRAIFEINPQREGKAIELKIEASPTSIKWIGPEGLVLECVYASTRTLRFRSDQQVELHLRVTRGSVLHFWDEKHASINARKTRARYMVDPLAGSVEIENAWTAEQNKEGGVIVCKPDTQGLLDVAIDEHGSSWIAPERISFEDCLKSQAESYQVFLEGMPHADKAYADARDLAAYINWSCVVEARGTMTQSGMLMSKNWMCNVWNWDNCFNAMATVESFPELAWEQILVMMKFQDEYGCYPDTLNDVTYIPNYTKPPVQGWAVLYMLEKTQWSIDNLTLENIYQSLSKWTQWYFNHRRLEGQKLPHYFHGNDSGWDNATLFDEGVPLIGPDLSAFLVTQMDALAKIAAHLGKGDDAERWTTRADELLNTLIEVCWNGEHFSGIHATSGKRIDSDCLLHYMPLVLGKRLPEKVFKSLIKSLNPFLTKWGLATEKCDSPKYISDGYWRGPIWAPSTYLIYWGLVDAGEKALAKQLAEGFAEMCKLSGHAENYDAQTGAGLRDRAYTWTSSVFLLLAQDLHHNIFD